MHAALKIARKTMQCSFLPQIPFNSTSSLSAPLLLPLLLAGVSFISGYLSPVAPKLFPAALTCSRRRRAAAHLSTLASLSPKFRYRTHRTTSTESGGRVFAFSLPPPPPSFLCHGVSGGTGGNSLPPSASPRPLSLPIPTTTKSCLRRAHSETWVVTFR